jgi:FixJ family two-component response regulator
MTGPELAKRLAAARPGMRVLFMSGYPGNSLAHQGVLAPGVAFLPKPLPPTALLGKVRQVLDAE